MAQLQRFIATLNQALLDGLDPKVLTILEMILARELRSHIPNPGTGNHGPSH